MEYEKIKKLSATKFLRLTGVKSEVFAQMVAVLQEVEDARCLRGGPKGRVSVADRLLIMLEYYREYRTQFHIGTSRGLSERRVGAIIRWCEDALAASGRFALPGKKALKQSDTAYEVVLIDATETPIERPKKSSERTIPARKSGTR